MMSKERELIKEILSHFAKGNITIRKFENSADIAETLYNAQELLTKHRDRELSFKIANAIADQFQIGFCDYRMVESFAEEIEKELEPFNITLKVAV